MVPKKRTPQKSSWNKAIAPQQLWRAPQTHWAVLLTLLLYGFYFAADVRSSGFNLLAWPEANAPTTIVNGDYGEPQRYRVVHQVFLFLISLTVRLWPIVNYETAYLYSHLLITVATALVLYGVMRRSFLITPFGAALGVAGFVFGFPMLFGYKFLIFLSLQDLFAYLFVLLALIGAVSGRYYLFIVTSIAAALSRETGLIAIIPVVIDRDHSLLKRATLAFPAIMAGIAIRYALGWDTGYMWLVHIENGLYYNLRELKSVTAAYLFAVFGVFWMLAGAGWVMLARRWRSLTRAEWILWASAPVAVCVLGTLNYLLAIFHEIRVMFLVFPWIISLGTIFFDQYRSRLITVKRMVVIATSTLTAALGLLAWVQVVPRGLGRTVAMLMSVPGFRQVHRVFFEVSNWFLFHQRYNRTDALQFPYLLLQSVAVIVMAVVILLHVTQPWFSSVFRRERWSKTNWRSQAKR